MRLVLFSGLGADESVFAPQRLAFPELLVPAWRVPDRGESFIDYCGAYAEQLRREGPCIVGGASFGGMVAQQVASLVPTRAVVLIGSACLPNELPRTVRWSRPLRPAIQPVLMKLLQGAAACGGRVLGRWLSPHVAGVVRQFCRSNPAVLSWSLRQLMVWRPPAPLDCPVYRIHGERDRVIRLRCRLTPPGRVVPGGGHVISLTHAREVNDFLREVLADVASR
ncbi:MAG: alpha/beta hydrolase [Planctomycetales bacterium]|nr:alpha/beta hydrolase [Planctomycetales bacterium]